MILYEILIVAFLIVALLTIGLILMQQGKGAEMGASFGAGGSNSMFGSAGAGNFLTKSTAVLITIFFVLCMILGAMSNGGGNKKTDTLDLNVEAVEQPKAGDVPVENVSASDVPSSDDK